MGSKDRSRSRSPHRSGSESDTWSCNNCSTDNKADKTKCYKCKLPKGKDRQEVFTEDWECSKCGSNNFSRRIDCYKCHSRKPPVDPKHPNDWECRKCKGNNFSRRIDCYQCGEPKPRFISSSDQHGGRGHRGSQEPRDGSWYCDCGSLNYSRRVDCYKCHIPKPNPRFNMRLEHSGYEPRNRIRSPTPERPYRQRSPIRFSTPNTIPERAPERAPDVDPVTGESKWLCPICGESNFYKRFDCFRCFEKKPLDGGIIMRGGRPYTEREFSDPPPRSTYNSYNQAPLTAAPAGPLSIPKKRFPTDWICPDCHGLNYSKRTDCFKCHLAKPEDAELEEFDNNSSATTVREGDWTCPSCGGNNFSRRIDCYRCKADKPAAEAW